MRASQVAGLFIVLLATANVSPAPSAEPEGAAPPLVVAVADNPPFATAGEDGEDRWRDVEHAYLGDQ